MVNNNLNLNAIRMLGVQAINKANSGHPGIVLDAAPIVYTLYADVMNIDPKDSKWFDRDRFVLSAGHGSALLYSILHLTGFNLSIDDLKQFRQLHSKTPGHPERGVVDGVEVTTGPLGQGIGMGVGMALAERSLSARFNKPGLDIVNHYTYVLCGDGDLQEGVANEAISFAGANRLNKLILLHDSNDVQLDDFVKAAQVENMQLRFQAAGWKTLKVENGEDTNAILEAIKTAQASELPTYIEVKTVIGLGATKEGTPAVHGAPLGADLDHVHEVYGWEYAPFEIPGSVYEFYQQTTQTRGSKAHELWNQKMSAYQTKYPEDFKILEDSLAQNWKFSLDELKTMVPTKPQATRISSGTVLNNLTKQIVNMVGGSADLSGSTKAAGADGKFSPENPIGRNIMYGVREFGMATINNGMAAHGGILPFASGFFVFSDYMKPALRLGALMELQQLYIFTHDSIAVGEDGPTHEPIEQLAMIRSIPNMILFRPADFQETYAAYNWALTHRDHPTTIVLTRQNLPELTHQDVIAEVNKGAYIIDDEQNATVTLLATGSEVHLALAVKPLLMQAGIRTRVVAMPSWEVFNQQEQSYQDKVIDRQTTRISLEMASTFGWAKYTGDNGLNIGIDTYGASAPGDQVIAEFGFTADKITQRILTFLKKK